MKTIKLITTLIFVGSLSACMSTSTQYETTVNADGSRKTTCSNTGGSVWDNACEQAAAANTSHQQIGSHTSGNIGVRTNRGGQWADHAKDVAKPQQEQPVKKMVPSSNAGGNQQAAAVAVEQVGGNALAQLLADNGYGNVIVNSGSITIEQVASFDSGSSMPSDIGKIASLAKLLKGNGVNSVVVTGYADTDSFSEGNQKLSVNRAQFVGLILQDHGLQVTAQGYAETGQYGDNRTESGKANNRTVSIKI